MNVGHSRPEPHHPEAWLLRAGSDLALARHAAAADDVLPEDAVYHAQQCAEKALKAVLLKQTGQFPFVQDLDILVERLEATRITIPEFVQNAGDLTQYAVQIRYPGDLVRPLRFALGFGSPAPRNDYWLV
ncbi:MAG TPA: HEPN domain-containing protein [Anaerolineae bacterium]|nr:HEPN domain-containing protein [Anaerolineae bacterium]